MAKSNNGCRCEDVKRDNWFIIDYKCNHSAFNGYRREPSDYSSIHCKLCGAAWRTKAKYVESLKFSNGDK